MGNTLPKAVVWEIERRVHEWIPSRYMKRVDGWFFVSFWVLWCLFSTILVLLGVIGPGWACVLLLVGFPIGFFALVALVTWTILELIPRRKNIRFLMDAAEKDPWYRLELLSASCEKSVQQIEGRLEEQKLLPVSSE